MQLITIGVCACGKRGTLVNHRCGFCEDGASNGQDARPKIAPHMTVARALDLLVAELTEDMPQPLVERFTLASIAADLCRLAGEPVPAVVLEALDGPDCAPYPLRETHREPAYAAD
jgi:hypothetical protein